MWKLYDGISVLCLAAALGAAPLPSHAEGDAPIEIVMMGAPDAPETRGAELGIDEANRMGRYFGIEFALEVQSERPPSDGAAIVIVAGDAKQVREAIAPHRLVLNAAASDDTLRDACPAGLFHTLPSARMHEDAAKQWLESGEEGDAPDVIAWDPSLVKFAARDLNKRFRERFETPMESRAWAGWAAARAIGEAAIRTGNRDATELGRYLRGEFALDGQKGIALTFRPNGQLRQPLYYRSGDNIVGEAPLSVVVPDRDLDSLGRIDCDTDH